MIGLIIFTIIIAFVHALEELEIEGKTKHGWARNLPTKRFCNKFTLFLVGKELTLYHIYLVSRVILFYHIVFVFSSWTIKKEFNIVAFISFYFVLEDFFWFLLNPKFRLSQFKKKYISWHKRWIFNFIPVSYFWGMIIGTLLLLLGRQL